jgi:hypothetical protein
MTALNWARLASRTRMRRQGIEAARDAQSIVAPLLKPRRPRPQPTTKAELRNQAAKAFVAWRARQGSSS